MKLDASGAVRASRGGFTSPFGKLDDALDGARIEGEVRERFNRRRCSLTNKPEAEVIRDFVRICALGKEQAVRMYGEGVLVVVQMIDSMPHDKEI